nr:MAG TPA_asm: hypothetical protein [Caudoviricetes sp.]
MFTNTIHYGMDSSTMKKIRSVEKSESTDSEKTLEGWF